MKVDCDIPGLSVSCLNSNVGKGSLWVAERATSNPNIYEVSTAWDWDAFTQDEMKAQLGIRWNADVNAAWNILVKNNDNVSSNLDRNEVERFVVDPVVLIPSGFNRG